MLRIFRNNRKPAQRNFSSMHRKIIALYEKIVGKQQKRMPNVQQKPELDFKQTYISKIYFFESVTFFGQIYLLFLYHTHPLWRRKKKEAEIYSAKTNEGLNFTPNFRKRLNTILKYTSFCSSSEGAKSLPK